VVQRLQVGVAHLQGAAQHRLALEQPRLAGEGQHLGDGPVVLGPDALEQRPQPRRHQTRHVAGRDIQVGLGEHHFDVRDEGAEEEPLLGCPRRRLPSTPRDGFAGVSS
jgi:hypothetical protein